MELKLAEKVLEQEQPEKIIRRTLQSIEDIVSVGELTNERLKQIVARVEVDKDGEVDIYLRDFGTLEISKTVPFHYTHACGCGEMNIVKNP